MPSCFSIAWRVPDECSPFSQVDRTVAALATLRNEVTGYIVEPCVAPQSAEELGPLHLQIVGQYCPKVKKGGEPHDGSGTKQKFL